MRIPKLLIPLLLVSALLASCGGNHSGSSDQTSADVPTPSLPGKLLVTGETSLDLVIQGHQTAVAKAPSVSSYFEYPAFSPDGKRIAYVLAVTPTAQGQDWGNDIYIANVDGSNAQLVLKHDKPGALIDSLNWTPDGQALIFAYSRAMYDAQNHYTGSIYQIQRTSIADKSVSALIDNAMQPSVSWDGKQLVYVDFPQNNASAASLALADIDGSNQHKLLSGQNGFQGFFAPHLSPDGTKVAFAAVGGPVSSPTDVPTPKTGASGLLSAGSNLARALLPQAASADGSPYQVWIASVDGSSLHTISNLREDLPFPLWASNGQEILFLGAGGLYTANADGTNLRRLGPGVPHGEIAWYQGS